jgi:hypothetical protein
MSFAPSYLIDPLTQRFAATVCSHTLANRRLRALFSFPQNSPARKLPALGTGAVGNREAAEKAMEALASECIDELVLSLLKIVQRLDSDVRVGTGSKDTSTKDITDSTRIVLQMMCRCLNAQWTSLRAKYAGLMVDITDLDQQIRLTEKLQAVVPPPLIESTAKAVVDMSCRTFAVEELRPIVLEVVFFVSMSNADIVVDRVCKDLETYLDKKSASNNTDELSPGLHFLRAANLPSDHLKRVFGTINVVIPALKRPGLVNGLCEVVHAAIWKWLENHSTDFVALWQRSERFAGDPLKMFGALRRSLWQTAFAHILPFILLTRLADLLEKKKGQPAKVWPAQTLLLVLCPDIMITIVSEKDSEYLVRCPDQLTVPT